MSDELHLNPRPVLLIDLSSIYWSAWHASGNEQLSSARTATLGGISRCRQACPDAMVAICCDSGRSFRKELLPTYKAQRPEKDHASLGELEKVKERLRLDGYLLWSADTCEADDVIATATEKAFSHGHQVTIASSDKDLLQLVRLGVSVLRTHTWETWDVLKVSEKLCPPSMLGDWLALVGDKSDNIAGAPGVGPKTATALLSEFGSLKGIYTAVFSGDDVCTPSVKRSLVDHSKAVELARKLVSLKTDVPIDFGEIYKPREVKSLSQNVNAGGPNVNADEQLDDGAEELIVEPAQWKPQHSQVDAPATRQMTLEQRQAVQANANPAPAPEPSTPEPAETALVPTYQGPFSLALEPNSAKSAMIMARYLFDSRLYQRFQNAEAIWAIIIRGREMGLPALTALDSFHIIQGRPAPSAMLLIARAKDHPDCEYFQCTESTPTLATWETKNRRNPKPTKLTYTIEQARAAGLVADNWIKRPDEMIRKTCAMQLARMEYPSVMLGLYASVELGGDDE